ncbi:alpha/beta hydrolase-fold protein [Opitutaceae bacterium]
MKSGFILASPETGTTYHLRVELPSGEVGSGRWPMVLFMDGDDQFAAAVAAYDAARAEGRVRPLTLVGVGYGASYRQPANRRGRDYTPTAHADEPGSGGGTEFLHFLTETLWPELQARYPVDLTVRGIAGHSLGSLLVLHALFQRVPFFTHHLASAPSIWWDDRSILRLAGERHASGQPLPVELFLSVGDDDSESMTGDLSLLESELVGAPFDGLRVHTMRFPLRNHFNVLPDAFFSGLCHLFPATDHP